MSLPPAYQLCGKVMFSVMSFHPGGGRKHVPIPWGLALPYGHLRTSLPYPRHTSIGKRAVGLRLTPFCIFRLVSLPVLRYGFISVQAKKLSSSDSSQDGYVTDEDEGAGQEKLKKNNKKEGATKKHKLAKELSDLVNYCKSTRFEDFATSQQTRESVVTFNIAANF